MFLRFIQPCSPVLANTVPAGDEWQHEIKFDGFRVQIHKLGNEVELYSRSGSRFGRRFPLLCKVLRELVLWTGLLQTIRPPSVPLGSSHSWRRWLSPAHKQK